MIGTKIMYKPKSLSLEAFCSKQKRRNKNKNSKGGDAYGTTDVTFTALLSNFMLINTWYQSPSST